MKAAAIVLCLLAVLAMSVAIRDMVLDRDDAPRGWALRAFAVAAFLLAVILNAAAR
ncbi:hypothetical protein NBH00_09935 [Paraconexibacter antarcticus]|uniref:Uncharacterized protein n=1 Tax=Paraconexibacter antarcticus TaxID=2949664 RepID=A0ABY5DWW1_9ACTN|nr:hypothetical protein [Paraconexibacter antarcticus]UTI66513.1 hypothetical protein NBH00_09935 [Paraconexibacter antarcticus]